MAEVRAESSASTSSVETLALQCNSLAVKLRNHLGAVQQLGVRIDGVNSAVEGLASNVDHLEADGKKVKKHVVKLEKNVEVSKNMDCSGTTTCGAKSKTA